MRKTLRWSGITSTSDKHLKANIYILRPDIIVICNTESKYTKLSASNAL